MCNRQQSSNQCLQREPAAVERIYEGEDAADLNPFLHAFCGFLFFPPAFRTFDRCRFRHCCSRQGMLPAVPVMGGDIPDQLRNARTDRALDMTGIRFSQGIAVEQCAFPVICRKDVPLAVR